jgi:hypothetical protein
LVVLGSGFKKLKKKKKTLFCRAVALVLYLFRYSWNKLQVSKKTKKNKKKKHSKSSVAMPFCHFRKYESLDEVALCDFAQSPVNLENNNYDTSPCLRDSTFGSGNDKKNDAKDDSNNLRDFTFGSGNDKKNDAKDDSNNHGQF